MVLNACETYQNIPICGTIYKGMTLYGWLNA